MRDDGVSDMLRGKAVPLALVSFRNLIARNRRCCTPCGPRKSGATWFQTRQLPFVGSACPRAALIFGKKDHQVQ